MRLLFSFEDICLEFEGKGYKGSCNFWLIDSLVLSVCKNYKSLFHHSSDVSDSPPKATMWRNCLVYARRVCIPYHCLTDLWSVPPVVFAWSMIHQMPWCPGVWVMITLIIILDARKFWKSMMWVCASEGLHNSPFLKRWANLLRIEMVIVRIKLRLLVS